MYRFNILPVVAILHEFLGFADVLPDISFSGVVLKSQSSVVYRFSCATDVIFWGCTVEFLVNGITIQDLRYVDDLCYNKNGICYPELCSCSRNCNEFTWNFTATKDMDNNTFECDTRIEENQRFFKANISMYLTGNAFINMRKNLVFLSGNPTKTLPKTTISTLLVGQSDNDHGHTHDEVTVAILCLIVIIIIIMIVISSVICYKLQLLKCCQRLKKRMIFFRNEQYQHDAVGKEPEGTEAGFSGNSCRHMTLPHDAVGKQPEGTEDGINYFR
ncbi:uncharacterized protein LOC143058136 [Mytilus galloprovincialis]|uniref:uncharacterized protein LOC143058136 n=1 Tax=Mytilus galloprovincialis TaxID=29158 RepID=UPI003F7CAACB